MKNIQISQELFIDLIDYHLLDQFDKEEAIKKGLEDKMDSIIKREKYTKSKTALTEEERLPLITAISLTSKTRYTSSMLI